MNAKRLLPSLLFMLPLYLLFRTSSPAEVGLFLCAAALHEAGHLFAAALLGYRPRGLALTPAGALISLDLSLAPYRKEILIYSAGPLMNGVAMLFSLFLLRRHFTLPVLYFFFCNGLFLLLNLMPVRGLDGYQALFALLSLRYDEKTADRILLPLHRIFLILIAAGGIAAFLYWKNASLLLFSFMLILEEQTKKATSIS